MKQTVYLGLGANLGEPVATLRQVIMQLHADPQFTAVRASSLYHSTPMGPSDQPDYVNAVVAAETLLSPLDLLNHVQAIEQQFGRQRLRRWGERSLDIDILLYGAQTMYSAELTIPHVGIGQRDFVLVPLLELAPQLQLPDGQRISDLWQRYQATAVGHDLQRIS